MNHNLFAILFAWVFGRFAVKTIAKAVKNLDRAVSDLEDVASYNSQQIYRNENEREEMLTEAAKLYDAGKELKTERDRAIAIANNIRNLISA
jgi:F0F1-type ATP synthase membrane subunit b/b'